MLRLSPRSRAGSTEPDQLHLHLKRYLWRMLIAAGECDHHVGAWASYLDAIEMGVRAEDRIGRNASYSQTHPELMRTFQNLAMLKGLSAALDPDAEAFVVKRLARFGFDVEQYFGPEITQVLGHVKGWGSEALWKNIEEQLHGPPLSDFGTVRRVRWNAQGVAWSFEWENDYNTTAVAEAFVATFQMLVVALSQVDLCVLPSDVKIMLRSYDQAAVDIRHQSTDGREWVVELPLDGTHSEEALAAAVKIYSSVSLLPDSRLMSELHAAFEAGLSNRVFFIQPYAVIYRTFFARDFFDESLRSNRTPPKPPPSYRVQVHPLLDARSGLGPGYDAAESKRAVAERYKRCLELLPHTLHRLRSHAPFKDVVVELRTAGWKDVTARERS